MKEETATTTLYLYNVPVEVKAALEEETRRKSYHESRRVSMNELVVGILTQWVKTEKGDDFIETT